MFTPFPEIKKNFGFGAMRLPMKDDTIDHEYFTQMVDTFMESGFNYFDTAHCYHGGFSEIALRECLTKRYPRESFLLTNKLTENYFQTQEDIRPFFESQLNDCGVEYFDFYLLHAQHSGNYPKYQQTKAYETVMELKREGKIRHVGFSFHDNAECLDKILTDHPEVEVVQLQFNYLDYEDDRVQGRLCYEVCCKHQKPVIVMEPVRGGRLVNIPERAKDVFTSVGSGSVASFALRYAASFDNIFMVLSGMSNMEQVLDNVATFQNFKPLNEEEFAACYKVTDILRRRDIVPCTACRYCTDECPAKINIPTLFDILNQERRERSPANTEAYIAATQTSGQASDCLACGLCERSCPQHLKIRELLGEVKKTFEKE